MTIDILYYTKIAKVLRHIQLKDDLPFPETYRFRERAKVLMDQWACVSAFRFGDYPKGSGFKGFGDLDAISPILHDMMMARKGCAIGPGGGLNEVTVGNAACTIVTLPCS